MRIVGAPWFDLSFLKERQLFAKEEILRGQGAVGTGRVSGAERMGQCGSAMRGHGAAG